MNLLLYPESVKFKRRHSLDPKRFQYLEGCVRTEKPYEVPRFGKNRRFCGDRHRLRPRHDVPTYLAEMRKRKFQVSLSVTEG